jgi:hypothetical protein
MKSFGSPIVLGCSVFLLMASLAAAGEPERFRGMVANLGGPASGQTWHLTMQADRYTTDEEISALATTLANDGQEALMKALGDIEPVGWIRIGSGTSYHLRAIRSVVTPEGVRIVRGYTDRPLQAPEVLGNLRSRAYTLGVVEITFDAEGKGSGSLLPMCQISFTDANTIEIETFGIQPTKLLSVKAEPVQKKK